MRGRLRYVLFGLLLAICLGYQMAVWTGIYQSTEVLSPPRKVRKPVNVFEKPWHDETHYIVISICTDLAEMMYFATHHKGLGSHFLVEARLMQPHQGSLRYAVRAHLSKQLEVNSTLVLDRALWDPALYLPWCQALSQHLQPIPAHHPIQISDRVVQELTDPQPQVLASLDAQLSRSGPDQLASAAWHDQAALLLASLALREPAGLFFQIRHELCRLTSHLAMSDFLRRGKPAPECHQLALACLLNLYGNEKEATKIVENLSDKGTSGVWKRALQMRLTGDYRIGEKTAQPTLLEERECFGAEYAYRSCQLAWRHRPKAKAWQNLTDWTRLANTEAVHHADEPGVRVGHELLKLGLPAELREIQSVWAEEGWGKLSPNQFQAFLNTPPQRCVGGSADRPQLQVLGKGLWGAFLQRQLCHTMKADHHFLHRIYASPDEASAYRSQANKLASQLLLYPFLLRQMAPTEDLYRQAQEGSMKVIRSNPQSVPAGVWNWVCYETDFCPIYVPGGPAWVNEWHRYNPPSGTAYDVHPRMNHPSLTGRKDFVEQMRTWQAQAPHNRILYTHLMRILREKGTPLSKPEMLQILGPVMEYDADAVFRLATETATTPTEYLEYLERAARLNPRYSLKLLEAYRDQNNPGEHEAAFVRWIDTDPDPVQVANVAHEMIEYWEQSGQKTKATQLAERAAQAGSLSGLCAKGHLLERRGQPEQALPYYQEVYRRYENAGPMLGCLKRMAVKNPVYQDKFRQAVEQSLNALTPFQKPSDSAPPQRGVTPRDPEVGGLESSDIIVAVRGYQVTNQDHYVALRDMQVFEPFSLVVYRRGQYLELGPYPYEHRVGPLKALSE